MKTNDYVIIQKVAQIADALYQAAQKDEYKPGQINPGVSTPIDYTCEGTLLGDIVVGKSVLMFRKYRNGVRADGVFQTSTVTKIEGNRFYTLNSEYIVTLPEGM